MGTQHIYGRLHRRNRYGNQCRPCGAGTSGYEGRNKRTDFDGIVCGGGIAGIAAALASAREGASTCLPEKEYCLGGLATLGLIVVCLPLCDGDGVQMSGSIAEELALISLKYGPGTIPEVWKNKGTTPGECAGKRYEVRCQAAP